MKTPRTTRAAVLAFALAAPLTGAPATAQSEAAWTRVDELVQQAIRDHKLPGAVVLAGQGDRVLLRKAIGARAVDPVQEAMTLDTVFDAASLTKVVATTTSVMILVEEGRIRLGDLVSDLRAGLRAVRQARHHDPAPPHAHVRPAPRRRPHLRLGGPRSRHRAGRRGSAAGPPRRSASSTATSTSSSSATSSAR